MGGEERNASDKKTQDSMTQRRKSGDFESEGRELELKLQSNC